MKKSVGVIGAILMSCATASQAGIPTVQKQTCPVGGTKFETTGTASCSQFGLTHDFYLWRPSSCDFVTHLPQCPDNKLPLYKEFSDKEVAMLKDHLDSADYQAIRDQSRYLIAKKLDDFLVANGSARTMDFWYLLGGLQYDRENLEGLADYRQWVIEAATEEVSKADAENAPFIRLVMAHIYFRGGHFEEADSVLQAIKDDPVVKDHQLAKAYYARMDECVKAKDLALCPSSDRIIRKEG